jgi:hypothetical protein
VPAAAVIRVGQVLFIVTWRKGLTDGYLTNTRNSKKDVGTFVSDWMNFKYVMGRWNEQWTNEIV